MADFHFRLLHSLSLFLSLNDAQNACEKENQMEKRLLSKILNLPEEKKSLW